MAANHWSGPPHLLFSNASLHAAVMTKLVLYHLNQLALLGILVPAIAHAQLPEKVDFNFHIKPILSDRCYNCHGPDEENRQGGFRLDREESAFDEADSGMHPIVPGDAEASEILARLTADDKSIRMPHADSKLTVTKEEIALIRRWIEQGAEWKQHWSFLPLSSAKPQAAEDWGQNEIDSFVLANLHAKKLEPAPPATREQLIRRVTFDLTGLPPTIAEVDAFVADESTDAYGKVVDRLLDSPRYGERMAVDWLDLARYADTYGYQTDRFRAVWSWRDWVVRAFNENLSYDRFVLWQLAVNEHRTYW